MSFWERNVASQNVTISPDQVTDRNADSFVLDEEAMAEIQDPSTDIFEDEEDDINELMSDASLRLEQGRLYQMVLQQDIFAETNADPRAIKNVQREIRKHAKERLEILLGIRQESEVKETIVSSPFNNVEVTALKMVAYKVTNGASAGESLNPKVESGPQPAPKKDGITAISGNASTKPATTPLNKTAKNPLKPTPTPSKGRPLKEGKKTESALNKDEDGNLTKPISEMTPEELAAHDNAAIERRRKNYSSMPANLVPHPTPQQLEMKYTMEAQQLLAPGSAISTVMALMNNRK